MVINKNRRSIILGCVITLMFTSMEILRNSEWYLTEYISLQCQYENKMPVLPKPTPPTCPDVSQGMMKGTWRTRPLTQSEKSKLGLFYQSTLQKLHLPDVMQREDGKCGMLTYGDQWPWFRALCNPEGSTPCCYKGKCVAKDTKECACAECYDLRTRVQAEYSTWVPEDPRCQVNDFSGDDVCEVLNGTQLFLLGDSLTRHIQTAFLQKLTNFNNNCTVEEVVPTDVFAECTEMYFYSKRVCYEYIRKHLPLCGGTTNLIYKNFRFIEEVSDFKSVIKELLHKPKTIIYVGIGPHDKFDMGVFKEFILPAIQLLQKNQAFWPRVIWATTHRYGLLKTPLWPEQLDTNVKKFNDFIVNNLRQYNIPIFDTWNVTSGVRSTDGVHFGPGVNHLKVNLLLHFLQEMKRKERW